MTFVTFKTWKGLFKKPVEKAYSKNLLKSLFKSLLRFQSLNILFLNLPAWWMDRDDVAALSYLEFVHAPHFRWLSLSCFHSQSCYYCYCSEADWNVRQFFCSFRADWSSRIHRSLRRVAFAVASRAVLEFVGAGDGDIYGHWRWLATLHCIDGIVPCRRSIAPTFANDNDDFVGCENCQKTLIKPWTQPTIVPFNSINQHTHTRWTEMTFIYKHIMHVAQDIT